MRNIVITGASDGIGAASARQLKVKGYNVILVGRSKAKTEALARELKAPFHLADYTRLSEVKRLSEELNIFYDRIDVLANNAGGIMGERQITEDGFEKTFQVNHLAPFLLTKLLLSKLVASKAMVIQTASAAANMYGSKFDKYDLNNSKAYAPHTAYGNGKLANILFTRELHKRHAVDGISAVAFHPGVVRSSFASDTTHFMRFLYHSPLKYLITIAPEKSAHRLIWLAEGVPDQDWQRGQVYDGIKPMTVAFRDDGSAARKLWDESELMVQGFLR